MQENSFPIKKCGYVALVGRPNTGKSTLVNTIIGEKVSIVSPVPQTTRKRVFGIYNDEESQIIFFDTPGLYEGMSMFQDYINKQIEISLQEGDIILHCVDSTRKIGKEERRIKEKLSKFSCPIFTVYTKRDLPPVIPFESGKHVFHVSSITRQGIEDLLSAVKQYLPVAPILYPEEYYTHQSMGFRISEIIREKIFLHTKEEVPHETYVEVQEIEETPSVLKIVAYIYTYTESQKGIIIGKEGSLLTAIGKESRSELEAIFQKKVYLFLRVKTLPKWKKKHTVLKKYFYSME